MGILVSVLGMFAVLGLLNDPQEHGGLAGFVFDQITGKPITGALAILGEDRYGQVTDGNGRFLFSGIPAGTYLFRVEYRCFKPWILYHLEIKNEERAELKIALSDPSRLVDQMPSDSVVVRQRMLFYNPDSLNKKYRMRQVNPDSSMRHR
jgi:hypothetical protein